MEEGRREGYCVLMYDVSIIKQNNSSSIFTSEFAGRRSLSRRVCLTRGWRGGRLECHCGGLTLTGRGRKMFVEYICRRVMEEEGEREGGSG